MAGEPCFRRRLPALQQPRLSSFGNCFSAALGVQLGEDVDGMAFHNADGDEELGSNFFIGAHGGDQVQKFQLAPAESSPWAGVTFTCNSTRRVWCVQD